MTAAAETVMWVGNVRRLPYAEQIRATVAAGFDMLSVTPLQYAHSLADGLSTEDLVAMAADSGVRLSYLDPCCTWARRWRPSNIGNEMPMAFFSFSVGDFMRIGEAIGAESITAITIAPAGSISVDELTEDFAALCDRAAEHGLRCDLEFIPLDWAIPDLATAWKIVKDAGKTNSALTIDFWHIVRSGSSLELLRSIPGEKISCVQITDGLESVPAHRSRFQDCLEDRMMPGTGAFPIAAILRTLQESGGLRRVGPELFSSTLDAMSAEEIGRTCREAQDTALALIGRA
jgi:sugar phosphate isomerase/epimerase